MNAKWLAIRFGVQKNTVIAGAILAFSPLVFYGLWLSAGYVGLLLLGISPHLNAINESIILTKGQFNTGCVSLLIVTLLPLSLMGLLIGGIWRYVGAITLGLLLGLSALLSLALLLDQAFFHLIVSAYPWNWYALVMISNNDSVRAHLLIITGLLLFFLIVFLFPFLPFNRKKPLGESHFAHFFEIKKAGLFAKKGIVLAKKAGKILRVTGFEPVLVVAPMGSGKSAAFAIPNLIEWEDSVVVNDLKGELWEKTAKYRRQVLSQECYCWSPASSETENTHRYNPFDYVSHDRLFWYRDFQLIAQALIPESKNGESFWVQSSRDIFLFLSFYLFDTAGRASLGEIYNLAKQDDFFAWLTEVLEEGRGRYSDEVLRHAAALHNADARTRNNILQDFYARISLFGDPIIQKNTATSDFDLRDLRKKRMSVYIHIPEREKERLSPLLSLFWAQFIDNMTLKEPDLKTEPFAVLALLDEFGSLSRIEKLKNGNSFLRSFRIITALILQYLGQVESVYGKIDSRGFLNTKIKMIFTLNDKYDAEYISQCLGQTTIKMKGRSINRNSRDLGVTVNHSDQLRPLMRPEEIMRLPKNDALILVEGSMPIRAKKCFWFKERLYQEKLLRTGI